MGYFSLAVVALILQRSRQGKLLHFQVKSSCYVDKCVTLMDTYNVNNKEGKIMKFITIRDFRTKSSKIQKDLPKEKEMVLTSNGRPVAILTSVSENNLDRSLNLIRKARAMETVVSMQGRAAEKGLGKMSIEEINQEIALSRKERSQK